MSGPLSTPSAGRSSIRTAVETAMASIGADGLFEPSASSAVRVAIDDAGPVTFDHPAELFGPWDRLPRTARKALRTLIEADVARALDLWPHGSLWTGAVRSVRMLDRFMDEHGVGGGLRGRVVTWGERLRGGPATLDRRRRDEREHRRWRSSGPIGPATVLVRLGLDPAWLLGDFARGVRPDERAPHFYHDPTRNVVRGYHVSFDLIPTPHGWVLSEVNVEPGTIQPRLEHRFGDALAEGIVESAVNQGARRIYLFESHRFEARDWILRGLQRAAADAGVSVQVFEDPCMPPRRSVAPGGVPGRWPYRFDPPRDSLVVHRNAFAVGSDHLLNHKGALIRALGATLEVRGETSLRVLPMTRSPGEVSAPEHSGTPNLVYKYPHAMAGKGVFFMKVREADEAVRLARELDAGRDDGPGHFQPFVTSELIDGCVQDIRVWALLTPVETRFLRSVRSHQGTPLPESLPFGLVEGSKALMPKISFGGWDERVPPGQEAPIREVTQTLGSALRSMLAGTFVTSPGPVTGAGE